jgi:hypothetical protein
MSYTAEQRKAIKNLFEAMVESLSVTPGFAEYIEALRAVGLCLADATLDLTIVPLEDDQVSEQSDADWLKSMRIAPDLEVR